jgi:hypothetical protein
LRTNAPVEVTARTPLPSAAASSTVLTPLPQAPAAPTKMRAGLNPAYVVGFVALIVLAIAALLLWPRDKRQGSIVQLPQSATPTTTTTEPPQVAQASVTVTTATADSTQLSAPIATTPIAITTPPPVTATVAAIPPAPKPRPRVVPPPVEPKSEPDADGDPEIEDAEVPAFSRAATYRDGGDSGANDRALALLRRELRGTTTVALRAAGMTGELARALREEFPSIQFESHADVVIRFTGRNERLGAGRKRRAAIASVEKNGRVVFRYELPDEVYRVGQSSVEAFASVLGEAFQE